MNFHPGFLDRCKSLVFPEHKRIKSIRLYNMKKIFVFFLFFTGLSAEAQSGAGVSDHEPASTDSAAHLYFATLGSASAIYNGKLFYSYPGVIGDPFYPSGGWRKGSLLYDGSWYHDMPMMYDIVKDQVVSRHPNTISICLVSERVAKFYYDGQTFVRVITDRDKVLKTGFYQQLIGGKVTIIVARQKKIEEKIVDISLERRFVSVNTYYAFKDGQYYPVTRQKSLLDLLKDKRQSILKHLKKEKLKYRHDPEKTILAIAEFYNQF